MSWKRSKDVVESAFYVCRDMLWEKISHTFEETFFGWWTKVISTCPGEHLREIYPKISSLFELLSQENWLVLSERLSTAAEKSFWNRNVLKILQNYRKLSSNTVSRCYKFCVPRVQRNILGGILRIEQKVFAAFLAWRTLQKTENIRFFERKIYGCCCE